MVDTRWSSFYFSDLINNDILLIGDGYRAKNNELGGTGPIFLRSQHVKDSCIDLSGVDRFHAELADVVASKMSKVGDVIITTKGNSTGRVSYASLDLPVFVYSPHLSFWRSLKPDILHPDYLRYWSRGKDFQQQLCGLSCSTDMAPYLSLTDQRRLKIALPPIEEQRAIARILGSLDDKIELNRRMSETMEAMARAIFKSWFVDFDPVRAKAEGREPVGMDAMTAALFPDSFEETEMGMVPTDWNARTLGDVIEIHDSKRIPMANRQRAEHQGKYPYYGAASIMDYIDDYLFDGKYVLVGEDGSVVHKDGTPVIQYVWGKFWANNHAHVLTSKNGVCLEHLMLFLHQANIQPFITGAVQPKLNQANLCKIPFLKPSLAICNRFETIVAPIYDLIRANIEQLRSLAIIRDTLLQKLLSGKIIVASREITGMTK